MSKPVFAATYSDWRLVRTRGVVQIVLEIPINKANEAYDVLGGMPDPGKERWFAVAAIKTNQQAIKELVEVTKDAYLPERRLVQQSGIACKDIRFQLYLQKQGHISEACEQSAREYVQRVCQVPSRREILPDTPAGAIWADIYQSYLVWRDHPELVSA